MTIRIAATLAVLVATLLLLSCSSSAPHVTEPEENELVIDVQSMITDIARFSPDQADDLWAAIREEPMVYFRLVNPAWAAAVCDAFTDEFARMPTVNLQGDAHLEQYALNSSERGLDDFDDAVAGPAVLDMVRFLGSVELAIRHLGWESERDRLFDTFFDGYRRGLEDVGYMPPEPSIVRRIRERPTRTWEEYLAWAESLMEPLSPEHRRIFAGAIGELGAMYSRIRPGLPRHYFRVKSAGRLRLGIGSALTPKVLFRLEGSTLDPTDDLIIEAKELSDLSLIGCITLPATGEAYRVIAGNDRVGRLTHEIMAVVPDPDDQRPDLWDSWVRSWERSYEEIEIGEYRSADELAEVIHDVGAQLGAGAIPREELSVNAQKTLAQLNINEVLKPRICRTAVDMADRLIAAWEIVRDEQP